MEYSEAYRQRMIQKMTGPNAMSALALSQEESASQSALSKWLRDAKEGRRMKTNKKAVRQGNSIEGPRRPQDWSVAEKLKAVAETADMSEQELGGYLRRNGLHTSDMEGWRKMVAHALSQPSRPGMSASQKADRKRIKELERELRRKDKALAEAAALLVLKKKAQAIWGDEDADTQKKSGR